MLIVVFHHCSNFFIIMILLLVEEFVNLFINFSVRIPVIDKDLPSSINLFV